MLYAEILINQQEKKYLQRLKRKEIFIMFLNKKELKWIIGFIQCNGIYYIKNNKGILYNTNYYLNNYLIYNKLHKNNKNYKCKIWNILNNCDNVYARVHYLNKKNKCSIKKWLYIIKIPKLLNNKYIIINTLKYELINLNICKIGYMVTYDNLKILNFIKNILKIGIIKNNKYIIKNIKNIKKIYLILKNELIYLNKDLFSFIKIFNIMTNILLKKPINIKYKKINNKYIGIIDSIGIYNVCYKYYVCNNLKKNIINSIIIPNKYNLNIKNNYLINKNYIKYYLSIFKYIKKYPLKTYKNITLINFKKIFKFYFLKKH